MRKGKIRKAVIKGIVKENMTHQEFFDSFRLENKVNVELLAEETSKIPSDAAMNQTKNLRYAFVVLLGLILVLRLIGVVALSEDLGLNLVMLLLFILISIVVPIIGIMAALTKKVHLYFPVGILMALALFRSFRETKFEMDETTLIVMIPVVITIALAFYIPNKLKTPHKKSVQKEFRDGKEITKINYTFENSHFSNDNILDDVL